MPLTRDKKKKAAIALEAVQEASTKIPTKKNNPENSRAKKKEDSVKSILEFLEKESGVPRKKPEEDEDEELTFLFQEFE